MFKINKQFFLGYLFLSISITIAILYAYFKIYEYKSLADAYQYFKGFNYIVDNNVKIEDFRYFGRYPEFIFFYLFSFLSLIGPISNINLFYLIISSLVYSILSYGYLNIHKIYSFKLRSTQGLQLQLLAALLPLGLTTQVLRQTFGFSLFIFTIILFRKVKILSLFGPALALIFTHVGSSVLVFFEFFVKKKKLLINIFLILILYFTAEYFIIYLVNKRNIPIFGIFNFTFDFSKIDRFALLSIISLVFVKGKNFLIDRKFSMFLFFSISYLLISIQYTLFQRIFFGMGWFWLIIIGLNVLGEEKILKSKNKINFVCITLVGMKLISFLNLII